MNPKWKRQRRGVSAVAAASRRRLRKRFNITKSKYRTSLRNVGLSVKRLCVSGTPMTVSTTATSNFWRYQTVSLDSGFQQFDVGGTTLTNLTNLAEYQALFDEYKLSAYKVTLIPKFVDYAQQQGIAYNSTALVPYICIVKDPQSKLVPTGVWSATTLNTLLENGGKIYRADRPINIYMRPKVTEQYGSGADRYVSPKFTDLSSAAGTSMPHRGFHMFVFVGTWVSAQMANLAWDVRTTYYLKFKNPR